MLALSPHPADLAWPTATWPSGDPAPGRFNEVFDHAFDQPADLGQTLAAVVIHKGCLVAERYGPEVSPDTTLISWSMAKSVTHAWVGLLVGDGLLQLDQPTGFPEWTGDDRSAITLEHLLRMSSGLRWNEDYVDAGVSHVIEMLFRTGQDNVAAFAAAQPLDHPPGTHWYYSSGTTNLVARLCRDALGGDEQRSRAYLRERLFGPLGMATATPRFDKAGTFVGSSFLYASARDFARFGYLYLRDGVWDGVRILPEGWVDHARTETPGVPPEEGRYGAHWWLWRPETLGEFGAFGAHGYEGQYTIVVPGLDLVVVRLGKTPEDLKVNVTDWIAALARCWA